jgi:surface antigen
MSANTAWVPNGLDVRLTSVKRVVTKVAAKVKKVATAYSAKPANTYPWGQCTWGAAQLARDNVMGLGNARDWLWNAQRRGMATGYTPRIGATVVYQPYVQGASWLGHVAHVVSVLGGGRFVVEEMNYQEGGGVGGFGRWSYRTSWTGAGVSFIY